MTDFTEDELEAIYIAAGLSLPAPPRQVPKPPISMSRIPVSWWREVLDGQLRAINLKTFEIPVPTPDLRTYAYRRAQGMGCNIVTKTIGSLFYIQAYPKQFARDEVFLPPWEAATPVPPLPVHMVNNWEYVPYYQAVAAHIRRMQQQLIDADREPPVLPPFRLLTPPEPYKQPPAFPVPPVTQPRVPAPGDPDYVPRNDPENDWFFSVCDCGAQTTVMYDHDRSCAALRM